MACSGDHGADYERSGGHGEGFWEERYAGEDGREALDCFVVEWEVVEGADDNHAVDDDADVRCGGIAILEDTGAYNRVRRHVFLIHVKYDQAKRTDRERDVCTPRIPRIGYAAPGQRDKEAGRGGDENDRANPVDFGELLKERISGYAELDEERDHDQSHASEREVDPEDPALR